MLFRTFATAIFCFFVAGINYAQSGHISFSSLNTRHGLSSNMVNDMLRDKFGWMWFATEDGLNRFNGTQFIIYRHKPNDTTSISANDINCLYEDKAGNLWIGTNGGYLDLYDRKKDAFEHIGSYSGAKVLNSAIKTICSDTSGNLWIGDYSGLHQLNPATKEITNIPLNTNASSSSTRISVISVFEDSRNRLWVGTNQGLLLYNKQQKQFHPLETGSAHELQKNAIETITEDKQGNIWIGCASGLYRIDGNSNTIIPLIKDNATHCTAIDSGSRIWAGTEDGLYIIDNATKNAIRLAPDMRDPHSLNQKSVRAVYIDKQDICWVATLRGGVYKYDRGQPLFQYRQSNPFDINSLRSPAVTSLVETESDHLYVGSDGGGVQLFNHRTGLFSPIPFYPPGNCSPEKLKVLSLEKGSRDELWVGTFSNGLFCVNPFTGKTKQFTTANGLGNNAIFCLKKDSKGNIWIGSNGGGVNAYNPVTGIMKHYTSKPDTGEIRLPLNGYIRAIIEDAKGRIWIGSHGTGIAMLDPASNQCVVYNRFNSGLPSNVVISLLEDRKGNIWIGTLGGGLSIFDSTTHRFKSFAAKENLSNDVVYKIVEDDKGLLWLSTNQGISSFDVNKKHFANYNHYNGIQQDNFISGSGLQLKDGTILFGGMDGLNYFAPGAILRPLFKPPVVFTGLQVNNQSIAPGNNSPLREHISIARHINLTYHQNFAISFVALDFTSPHQNKYLYQLEGFDKEWVEAGSDLTASYTNIDPGDYTFHIKTYNAEGDIASAATASIYLHITPPFWRSVFAYIFYLLLIISLLLFSRYKTMLRLKRQFATEQEKLLARQTLAQERKEVEVAREMDQLKIKFLTNLSHEFRAPISLILGPVDNLLQSVNNTKAAAQLHMIRRNTRRLLNLVNQLLDFRKLETHELSLHLVSGEITHFVKDVFDSFMDLAERKKITYSFHCHTSNAMVLFDHDKLERILFNLLSNAFKFTPAGGSIDLHLESAGFTSEGVTIYSIKITDTGIGIPPDKKDRIFERYFQSHTSPFSQQGSGIGLSITHEFIKMHGGSIEVNSEPGNGADFTITLPLIPAEQQPILTVDNWKSEDVEVAANENLPLILLAEDDEDFRFYLKDNLKNHFSILEASNGEQGWKKTLARHPLVVISDVNMPEVDGFQLLEKIKADKRTSHIPVIMLTALSGEEALLQAFSLGASDYVTKPFNFQVLLARINSLVSLKTTLKTTYTKQITVEVPESETPSDDNLLIKKLRLYIENNISDTSLSVEGVSKEMGMSRSSLYNKMLELTGLSPIEYIRNIKLEKAAFLLEKTDMNIAQVAYSTGFATPNYFAKSFKAKYQMLPSEFVNRKRKNGK
ncbi:signal transduction histidine kinase/ligand-binding sensor domain-containing protein/DNA-binding response OmpR family regulator [Filimonas zeae]|nr:hybrid sensor histidine kinase/response regulator transcription factor [Filimonas zeae]MDR6337739.1 signal transduction histidine kinase/ligand-binding sensor domain-containing protein/DNA-binding response OmpR family regulator [Filimonas zeae]